MKEAQFTDWWRQSAEQPSRAKAEELQAQLAKIDIVPMIEQTVGRDLPTNRVTLIAARFCQPHGIRVTGTRFLLDIVKTRDALATEFLDRMVREEKLAPGRIELLVPKSVRLPEH